MVLPFLSCDARSAAGVVLYFDCVKRAGANPQFLFPMFRFNSSSTRRASVSGRRKLHQRPSNNGASGPVGLWNGYNVFPDLTNTSYDIYDVSSRLLLLLVP